MNEALELLKDGVIQATQLFNELSPQVWKMARRKVVADIVILFLVPIIPTIFSAVMVYWGYKLDSACDHPLFITGVVCMVGCAIVLCICIPSSVHELICIDYYTLKTAISMVTGH